MALQDLTPQLRTRLSRMERAVGWFVLLAAALLVFGFGYYLHNTAKRKGWFKTRVPYYTYVNSAAGLKVGDPVMLMGFEAGRIAQILPQRPDDFYHNVYVEFEIFEPNFGYLWTEGSRTKVEADFLGHRMLEVTKGTGGHATYLFYPLHELTLAEAERLDAPGKWLLGEDVYNETGLNVVINALVPLKQQTLASLRQFHHNTFAALDTREQRSSATVVWNDKMGKYVKFIPKDNPQAGLKKNLYYLPSEETPAVSKRLDKLLSEVEKALPNIFDLTNKIGAVLANGVNLTSNLNVVALSIRPASSNLNYISTQLRTPGGLGDWALGAKGRRNLETTLESVNTAVVHTDTNLTTLVENLARSLDNLADITSNLNVQVRANTNILSSISRAVVDTDDLVQGLKHHWLFRSAFKEKRTNAPPALPRLRSPKDQGNR